MRALLLASVVTLGFVQTARANLITNGDFSTGDLSGFTVSALNGGTAGAGYPLVTAFAVLDGQSSPAATFRVGSNNIGTQAGISLSQTITTLAGMLSVSFDLASNQRATDGTGNYDGGSYTLRVDGTSLATFSAGQIVGGQTIRRSLSGTTAVTGGSHVVSIDIGRIYATSSIVPYQYVDNISALMAAAPTSVPEPASMAVFATGMLGLGLIRRRKRA